MSYSARHRRFAQGKQARKGQDADRANEPQDAADYPTDPAPVAAREPQRPNKRRRHAA